MGCRFFSEGRDCRCAAVRGGMVPTIHERELFCRTDQWEACPTHLARQRRADPLSEDEYYQLWWPAPEGSMALGQSLHGVPRSGV
jgi:hypothetical protein